MDIKTIEVSGFKGALKGMRNPMESWGKSDTIYHVDGLPDIGPNDLRLAQTLIKAGAPDRKFLRMIHVQADINMTRYFWSEADTYHFGTKDSCSTMHKLLNSNRPITPELFVICKEDEDVAYMVIARLEQLRQEYKSIDPIEAEKRNHLLLRAKRILLEGFLQLRTWDTNYEELRNMYFQRRHHRLKEEWQMVVCRWIESLPYAQELITYEG